MNDKSVEKSIEHLKNSNKLERLLLNNADDALYFYSMDGRLIYINAAFEKITGYTTQELYEKNFIPFVYPDDQEWMMKLWEGLYKGDFIENIEYRIIKKSGEIRWCSSSWKIVLDDDGRQIGIQGKQQDITEHMMAKEELKSAIKLAEELSQTDQLTGLNNRRAFFDQGNRIFKEAIRYEHPISVVMMDIDYFKNVNDNFGHSVGDQLLQRIAHLLLKTVREIDIVARVGGEEFAFVFPETPLDEAVNLTERLRQEIANATVEDVKKPLQITASFGICSSSVQDETLETMLSKADNALYIAKKKGRNQVITCI